MNKWIDDGEESLVSFLRGRGVRKAAVFGSFARGEDTRAEQVPML